MIGLWIFKVYAHGKSGDYPMDKKPLVRKIFFNWDTMDDYHLECSSLFGEKYPDFCVVYDKYWGPSVKY